MSRSYRTEFMLPLSVLYQHFCRLPKPISNIDPVHLWLPLMEDKLLLSVSSAWHGVNEQLLPLCWLHAVLNIMLFVASQFHWP